MIEWTEEAKRTAYEMAEAILSSDVIRARRSAAEFGDDRNLAVVAHHEWTNKLLADNLAETGEDRVRREKYGIKEDE